MLISDNISVEKKLGKEMRISLNLYDKPISMKNNLKIPNFDDNFLHDVISLDDLSIKMKIPSKEQKIKNACVTEIAEIPLNERYEYGFIRNGNCDYLAVAKPNALLLNSGDKHSVNENQ